MNLSYDVRANTINNRLYLRLAGMMNDAEAAAVADRIISEIRKLKPGFAVINDISELKPASLAATEHLRRAQEASVKAGSGRVIRIVGSQAITQMQWNRTLKQTQGAVAEVVSSLREAERILDGSAQNSRLKTHTSDE